MAKMMIDNTYLVTVISWTVLVHQLQLYVTEIHVLCHCHHT